DSPLPSEKEAISVLQDLGISNGQLNSENSDNNKVNEPVNESMDVLSITSIINNQNERTPIINEPPGCVPFVFVNDPIL
ncbi:21394_t:CDS:2, partial [Gigaspora margarita]